MSSEYNKTKSPFRGKFAGLNNRRRSSTPLSIKLNLVDSFDNGSLSSEEEEEESFVESKEYSQEDSYVQFSENSQVPQEDDMDRSNSNDSNSDSDKSELFQKNHVS